MISIAFQIVEFASFIGLMFAIWRVGKWPRWRVRAVVYGWAAFFVLALFWAILVPMALSRVMDAHLHVNTFPDGTIAMAALFGGWFWPLIIISICGYRDRKKSGVEPVA